MKFYCEENKQLYDTMEECERATAELRSKKNEQAKELQSLIDLEKELREKVNAYYEATRVYNTKYDAKRPFVFSYINSGTSNFDDIINHLISWK